MEIRQRRIDPEPITIFMAVMAVYGASVASLNYVRSHHHPLPSATRNRVLANINKIDTLLHEVTLDLRTIRGMFERTDLNRETGLRLGNGAYLSYDDFSLYQRVSANVFRTLGKAHAISLKLERDASRYDSLEMGSATNQLGAAYETFESLRVSRDLTVTAAWKGLDKLAGLMQAACENIREQLR